MDNVPVKLDAPAVPEFNYFVDNQVLTAGQLNTLTDYFDRQHRLSRARLIGAGIVSGLGLSVGNNPSSIVLQKGVALTSDGDLLVVPEDRTFTRFRSFTDNKAKYQPWDSLSLLELVDDNNDQEGSPRPVSQVPNADQMVAVLYLESYLRPPEDCTDTDCDNLGPKQMNQLRVLLVPEAEIAALMQRPGPPLSPVLDVAVRRVRMGGSQILGSNDLGNRFEAAIDASVEGFRAALQFAVDNYAALTNTPGFGNNWISRFNQIANTRNLERGVQHAYAALKDLADALREVHTTAASLAAQGFLMPGTFSKHIALGALSGDRPDLRQQFIESPILNRGDQVLERLRFSMRRIDLMLRGFSARGGRNGLRITPSRTVGELSDRAIPDYFESSENVPLHEFWNFEKSKQQNTGAVRSYHAANYSNNPAALDPLNFTHDDCIFYRVEGILGSEKDSVLQALVNLRNDQNLPFRVESVQIEQDITRIVLPPRLRLPMWESAWHFQRENMYDHFQLAADYATKLTATAVSSDVDSNSSVDVKIQNAKRLAPQIKNDLDNATQALYVSPKTFTANYNSFKAPYVAAIKTGFEVNSAVQQFAQTPTESPLQQFAVFNHAAKLDRLMDIYNRKIDGIKRQLIFDNFQNNHPGMEFLGGVPAGGTLVVVHQNDRVVANFSLPYAVEFDLDPEVDVSPPKNGTAVPPTHFIDPNNFKWIDVFGKYKDAGVSLDLKKVTDLTLDVESVKLQLSSTDSIVTKWLPLMVNQNTKPNTGITTGTINDLNLSARVDRATMYGQIINHMESQGNLTQEQEQTLSGLRMEYDKEVAGTVGYIAQNNLEVAVGTDAFVAMDKLGTSINTASANTLNRLTLTKDLPGKVEISSKPNLNIMVTGFKLNK